MRTFTPSLLPFWLSLHLFAAEPPAVGEKAPDFELASMSGKMVRLSSELENGRVVLVVLRGFPGYQCPYCNRQVQDYVRNSASFTSVRVLLIYPGAAADAAVRAREFAQNKDLPATFDLLPDPDYRITNLYNLRWDAPGETAYPSTFVLDRDGRVAFARISRSHGGRTTAAEIATELQKSSKK
jgi:peroxiredoxin Q/BCP